MDVIRKEPGFANDELAHIGRILESAPFGPLDYKDSSYQHYYFQPNVKPVDLFSAFHGIDYKDDLKGSVCPNNGHFVFEGTLTGYVHDNWNFSDSGFRSTRQPFGTVSWLPEWIRSLREEEFRQLELHGYTKPFDIDGQQARKVKITAHTGSLPTVQETSQY